ncbi:hypothetical protein PUN28_011316 [Cardiocondyla obscurior]|uniref:Uncharacterized protein n=1 Tax=Cardiocondyla obscurior TaxID=286306 RepID=A0AAW2FIL2_9HYME
MRSAVRDTRSTRTGHTLYIVPLDARTNVSLKVMKNGNDITALQRTDALISLSFYIYMYICIYKSRKSHFELYLLRVSFIHRGLNQFFSLFSF